MAELSLQDRCKLAVELIEQSPPGEVNDIINDIRTIIGDDEALMPYVAPRLRAYNLSQLTVIDHTAAEGGANHPSLLSEAAVLPGSSSEGKERYVDAEGKKSFAFDHVTMTVSDYEPYDLPEEEEKFRSELAKSLAAYTKNHFPSGHSSVQCSQFPVLPPLPTPPATATMAATAENESGPDKPVVSGGMETAVEEPVTDVVPEQVASGEAEPAPTPALGVGAEEKREEVTEEGGLERLDEKVEEAKEEEEGRSEEHAQAERGASAGVEEPKVEEVDPAVGEAEAAVDSMEAGRVGEKELEQRIQQKVDDPTFTLEIIGNRYNPSNFWTGRWRTRWIVSPSQSSVSGHVQVDVHYYEQGNVQLATSHSASFPLPSAPKGDQSIASQVVTAISKIETEYHLQLNDVYGELGDKAFRALRRALPVTRQKMEWEKVSGYSLGSDLTKARA